jgi:hypothetical protein
MTAQHLIATRTEISSLYDFPAVAAAGGDTLAEANLGLLKT